MRDCFVPKTFKAESVDRINKANAVIREYMRAGHKMTLRQLYYQFVSRFNMENTERSYKNFANLISEARLAGLVDWDAIRDMGRVAQVPWHFTDLAEAVNSIVEGYKLDRWEGQRDYVELWVEKQALEGVLTSVARRYDVTLSVNKGYSSSSAMYSAAQRFVAAQDRGLDTHLIYLGDHDPSGEDMVRDIRDRLATFRVEDLNVVKAALTREQIEERRLPPNPAKKTDSRFGKYEEQHGNESWELDALDPTTLESIARSHIEKFVDEDALEAVKAKEESDKNVLRRALAGQFGQPE